MVGRAYGFARYTRNAALQFYINLLARDRFVERTQGTDRPTIPWNLREYKFWMAIIYVDQATTRIRHGSEGRRGRKMRPSLDCLIKPPRPLRSFG